MDMLGFTVRKGKIILPLKRQEKLIDNLKGAMMAERLSKRARQRILELIEAAQLAISHIRLGYHLFLEEEAYYTLILLSLSRNGIKIILKISKDLEA